MKDVVTGADRSRDSSESLPGVDTDIDA